MSSPVEIHVATEGDIDAAVARRLIEHVGAQVGMVRPAGGKSRLDPKIPNYNRAARHAPWLILRDLDHDASCAGALVPMVLRETAAPFLRLRISVRAVESWLLCDRTAIAQLLKIRETQIPVAVEALDDPKLTIVNLARASRSSAVKEAFVPHPRAGRKEGPEYAVEMMRFAREIWNVEISIAKGASPSLSKAVMRLRELTV